MSSLAGTWELIRAEQNGEASPEFVALGVQLELTANTYVVRLAGQVADSGTFSVDEVGKLTLTGTKGPNAGRTIPCIFQLVGDRLRVCYGLGGNLPDAFTTTPGKRLYLASYRRQIGPAPNASHNSSETDNAT